MEYSPVACMRQSSRYCRSESLGCLHRNFPLARAMVSRDNHSCRFGVNRFCRFPLLGLALLLSCIGPIVRSVKLQYDGVVHHPTIAALMNRLRTQASYVWLKVSQRRSGRFAAGVAVDHAAALL